MSRELFMLRAAGIVAFAGLVPSCQGPPQLAYTELAVMTYAVGPTRTYKTLQDIVGVLQPGDTVNVDYSATPYPAGVTFTVTGTASNPIRIHGVPDATGRRPVIKSAVNAAGQPNVVHIKYADYYVLENLEIDGSAGQGNGWAGTLGTFRCIFHQGGGEIARSGGLDTHHPLYIETDPFAYPGAVFRMQYTYVHDGTGGNLLKSRAERNEIYYNWIQQSAYHDVELIGLDSSDAPPRPMNSDVVGNVIEQPAIGIIDTTAVRIGHDWVEASGLPGSHGRYRFVANTFLMPAGTTAAVMKAEGALESLEVHDNVFYSPSTPLTILVDNAGDPAQWTTGRAVSGSNNQ
ncbi:MAG: hypothetical protein E6J90_49510 [Deltaproteobacteria bacterium]|nr:MAG: hypothetical protein E6J90_49510 [Deltaproteobacteria bacterium]